MEEDSKANQDLSNVGTGQFVPPGVGNLDAVLNEYEFIGTLGQGGMGTVYEAVQKSINRPVAIKILPKGEADDELRFADRFQREVHVMAQMSHPNIVTVYSFGETTDGQLFFVMEYVKGKDLHRIMHRGGIELGLVYKWIEQICDALFYAHSMGVIHRDIKPANILITAKGDVKITDFGLAKLTGGNITDEHSRLTKTNMAMGTPDYVAPEILETDGKIDHRVDIYAIGVMLYEMLTGKIPRGAWKPPSLLVKGLNSGFDGIVIKAMDPDQELRFKDAGEFCTELLKVRDEPAVAKFASPKPKNKLVTGSAAMRKLASPSIKKTATSEPSKPPSTTKKPNTSRKVMAKTSTTNFSSVILGTLTITVVLLGAIAWLKKKNTAPANAVSDGSNTVAMETVEATGDALHRKAALWILSAKGQFHIQDSNGKILKITAKDELPEKGYSVVGFVIFDHQSTNEDVKFFERINTLGSFSLVRSLINDEGLAYFGHSPTLRGINVVGCRITGSGLENFSGLEKIREMRAGNTPFSDVGMKHLARSSELKLIILDETEITDTGLAFLSGKQTLETLNISSTAITSAGLDQLRGLTGLKTFLALDCPGITKEALLAFQKAHPNCKIEASQ